MTLNEIRNAFVLKFNRESRKRKLNYEIPADREIALLISEAEQDVQRRLRIVESSSTVTITSGVGTLPSNFGSIRGVKWGTEFLKERSITDVRKAQAYESVSEPNIYALDTGSSYQLLVYPTDVTSVTVYYTVDSLYHQPSASTEYWGSTTQPFDDGFSGNLILPNRYAFAIQLYMLAQYFDEMEIKYERELNSLKHSRPSTLSAPKYNFGGLEDDGVFETTRSQNASAQTSSGGGDVYDKHVKIFTTEGSSSFSETLNNNFGAIGKSLSGNTLTLTSSGEFTQGKTILDCSTDFIWSWTSASEIVITFPFSGWTSATIEIHVDE